MSPARHKWIRPLVWGTAGAALSIAVFVFWNQSVAYPSSTTKQDWGQAGAVLDRLAVFGYDSHEERLRVGEGERASGRPKNSLRHFQLASQMNPRSVEAQTSMANVLHKLGKIDASIEHYLEALAIQPDFADAHYNLGNALATRHRYREAVDHFRAVTRLRPDFSSGYTNLGNALLRIGDKEGAIDAYRAAVRIDPDATNARNNLDRALRIQ
jgi:tetratricopeptide (TPR) repeat protein